MTSLFEVLFQKTTYHINDHHVEATCRTQDLGRYLEGRGNSMTLQQIVSCQNLFEVGVYNYF